MLCQMFVLVVVAIIAIPILLSWWGRGWYAMVDSDDFWFDDIPDMTGKVVVITGVNSATGYIAAREFAKKGANVYGTYGIFSNGPAVAEGTMIDSRNMNRNNKDKDYNGNKDKYVEERRGIDRYKDKMAVELQDYKIHRGGGGRGVVGDVYNIFDFVRWQRRDSNRKQTVGSVKFRRVNMDNLDDVEKFAVELKTKVNKSIDFLMLNDEVKMVPFNLTDGFEYQFAYNYLGNFLLVKMLLESLVRSGTRVLTITNTAHRVSYNSGIWFDGLRPLLKSSKGYNSVNAYGQSKLATILLSNKLHREFQSRHSKATSNAVYPGMIYTPNHFPLTELDVSRREKIKQEEEVERQKIKVVTKVEHFNSKNKKIYHHENSSFIQKSVLEREMARKNVTSLAVDKFKLFSWRTFSWVFSRFKLLCELPSEGFMSFFYLASMDAEIGAITQIRVATDPRFKGESGNYYEPIGKQVDPSRFAMDEKLQDRLWDWSCEKTKDYWLPVKEKKKYDYNKLWESAGCLQSLCVFVSYELCNNIGYRLDSNLDNKLDSKEFMKFLEKVDRNRDGVYYEDEVREYLLHEFVEANEDENVVNKFIEFLQCQKNVTMLPSKVSSSGIKLDSNTNINDNNNKNDNNSNDNNNNNIKKIDDDDNNYSVDIKNVADGSIRVDTSIEVDVTKVGLDELKHVFEKRYGSNNNSGDNVVGIDDVYESLSGVKDLLFPSHWTKADLFTTLDSDANGKLTYVEVFNYLEKESDGKTTKDYHVNSVNAKTSIEADVNGDVNGERWRQNVEKPREIPESNMPSSSECQQVAETIERERDSFGRFLIDQPNLLKALPGISPAKVKNLHATFSRFDFSGDNILNKGEIRGLLGVADQNENNEISGAEVYRLLLENDINNNNINNYNSKGSSKIGDLSKSKSKLAHPWDHSFYINLAADINTVLGGDEELFILPSPDEDDSCADGSCVSNMRQLQIATRDALACLSLDPDGNGQITSKELVKFFQLTDANDDEVVTSKEAFQLVSIFSQKSCMAFLKTINLGECLYGDDACKNGLPTNDLPLLAYDQNSNGLVTVSEAKDHFSKFDSDNNGMNSPAEVAYPLTVTNVDLSAIYRLSNIIYALPLSLSSKNIDISIRELASLHSITSSSLQVLQYMDGNNDGLISRAEMGKVIDEFDKDKDKQLTETEINIFIYKIIGEYQEGDNILRDVTLLLSVKMILSMPEPETPYRLDGSDPSLNFQLLIEYDKDKNGVLDLREIEFLKRDADNNNDNHVDVYELLLFVGEDGFKI